MTVQEVRQYSPLALAFMGDAVYEQCCREKFMQTANMPANKLHKLTVKKVCAEYQCNAVKYLLENNLLLEDECDMLKRGRNANGITAPRHSTIGEYRAATGLECMFGYLHLCGRTQRISQIFDIIWCLEEF